MITRVTLLILFFLFFVSVRPVNSQDSLAVIVASWHKLTREFQRRSDLISSLASILGKSSYTEKTVVDKTRKSSLELIYFVDTCKKHDSVTVQLAYQKNSDVFKGVSKILLMLEGDSLKNNGQIIGHQMLLEQIELQISIAQRNYNNICKYYRRPDLFYGKSIGRLQ